jgi:hypothetical protein
LHKSSILPPKKLAFEERCKLGVSTHGTPVNPVKKIVEEMVGERLVPFTTAFHTEDICELTMPVYGTEIFGEKLELQLTHLQQ